MKIKVNIKKTFTQNDRKQALKIALIYTAVGLTWVLSSNFAENQLTKTITAVMYFEAFEDCIFVFSSAMLLYLLLVYQFRRNTTVEANLIKSETRLSLALTATRMGVWEWNLQSNDVFWSPECYDIIGIKEFKGTFAAFSELIHPDDTAYIMATTEKALEQRANFSTEFRIIRPDGELCWLSNHGGATYNADGKPLTIFGTVRDITKQKRSEEILRNSEEQFVKAFNQCPFMMTISTLEEGRYIEINEPFLKTLGLRKDEAIGLTFRETNIYVNPVQRDLFVEIAQNQGFIKDHEIKLRKRDGNIIMCLFSAQVIELQQKQFLLTTMIDITDRKKAEEALKSSEERYRRLFEVESDPVLMVDLRTGLFTEVNTSARKMYGYTNEEFMQLSPINLSAEPDKTEESIGVSKTSIPLRWHLKKDGTVFPVEIAASYFEYQGRKMHVAVIRDITERIRNEKHLVELNQKLRALSEHLQTVQERERMAMARDIHDEIGQYLAVLKLDLEWIELRLHTDGSDLSERVNEMRASIDQMTASVQQLAANLRPPLLDSLGLTAAIEWHIDEFRRRSGLECYVMLNEDIDPLDQQVSTAVMRIVQEGLTNIARHARATEISVSLCRREGNLILEISDNGCGITPEQINSPTAYGLMGMQERARNCNGELTINGRPDYGTILSLSIPIDTGD